MTLISHYHKNTKEKSRMNLLPLFSNNLQKVVTKFFDNFFNTPLGVEYTLIYGEIRCFSKYKEWVSCERILLNVKTLEIIVLNKDSQVDYLVDLKEVVSTSRNKSSEPKYEFIDLSSKNYFSYY